jgi:YegS/Rv2252/BmrU family lipid kinase
MMAQLGTQGFDLVEYGMGHERFIMTSREGSTKAIPVYQNATLIFNPNAGKLRRNPRLLEEAVHALKEAGHGVELRPTNAPGHATELAKAAVERGADLIMASGGDGTINEVLNGMIGSSIPLGVLPAGTANVLAMETGMGKRPLEAARRLHEWEAVDVAAGLVRNLDGSIRRYFICMAGAGLDAYIVANINPNFKRALGKGAYWLAGFSSATRVMEEMHARLPDSHRKCSFALMSRVRNYGGDLEIALNASLLKEHFGVYLFEGSNPWRYFKYMAGVFTRQAAGMKGVTAVEIQELHLEPANGAEVHLQLDGEEAGLLPAQLEIAPRALRLLLPKEYLRQERSRWKT